MTNERGEIRVCNFVATKAHSQYEDALKKMRESLLLYGHGLPEVFYTDNMADKGMLQSCFESLLDDVVAVEKYAHLPTFTLPPAVSVSHLTTSTSMENVIRNIMEDLPTAGGNIVVGFDTEWNVDVSPQGHVTGKGPTAIIQVAYRTAVYVLSVS